MPGQKPQRTNRDNNDIATAAKTLIRQPMRTERALAWSTTAAARRKPGPQNQHTLRMYNAHASP